MATSYKQNLVNLAWADYVFPQTSEVCSEDQIPENLVNINKIKKKIDEEKSYWTRKLGEKVVYNHKFKAYAKHNMNIATRY